MGLCGGVGAPRTHNLDPLKTFFALKHFQRTLSNSYNEPTTPRNPFPVTTCSVRLVRAKKKTSELLKLKRDGPQATKLVSQGPETCTRDIEKCDQNGGTAAGVGFGSGGLRIGARVGLGAHSAI